MPSENKRLERAVPRDSLSWDCCLRRVCSLKDTFRFWGEEEHIFELSGFWSAESRAEEGSLYLHWSCRGLEGERRIFMPGAHLVLAVAMVASCRGRFVWEALLADLRLVLLLLLLEADLADLLLDFLPVDFDLGVRLNLFTGLGVDLTFDKRGAIMTASSAFSL